MADKSDKGSKDGGGEWKPDHEEAIRNIIRATVSASGAVKPEELPHIVRNRLSGQVSGKTDVDAYIRSVLEEMKKAGDV